MKLSLEQMQDVFPEKDIKAAFLRRDDISKLTPEEQAIEWSKGLPNVRKFLGFLSTQETLAVMNDKGQILI